MTYKQKFRRGDLVQIADDLGPHMSHFRGAGKRAIVLGSYKDLYGGGKDEKLDFSLWLEDGGPCSWYHEHQLTLIEKGQHDLLDEWEDIYRKKYGIDEDEDIE